MARQIRWRPEDESRELIFAVCERFLRGEKAASIARWVQRHCQRPSFRRTQIYPLLGAASRLGFFQLLPPLERQLAADLRAVYKLPHQDPESLIVVNAPGPAAHDHLTTAAAALVVRLMKRVVEQKRRSGVPRVEVHLGLGGGMTAMMVSRKIARALAAERELPPLVIHTLSSGGFLPNEPQKSPISCFSYFDGLPTEIECVALFTETVVSSDDFGLVTANPAVKCVMDRKNEIDIVVTSLAAASDRHGLLRRYLEWLREMGGIDEAKLDRMHQNGWIGDVQFRPYSAAGPMDDHCGVRAVTLLEISDLVEWANHTISAKSFGDQGKQTGSFKYIVLVAGPCAECGELKTVALKPLLENEKLRVFTHLVTDVATAQDLLQKAQEQMKK
ncbi:MAG: sugar-binding domain-containing protein [Thermoguttaceae bacterium]|nr:sugar-binding domain-containing protein [Thermoguttaceae bacterium]MDW8077723.1 hypothetical protein [Thermoguttaceae bacterium]